MAPDTMNEKNSQDPIERVRFLQKKVWWKRLLAWLLQPLDSWLGYMHHLKAGFRLYLTGNIATFSLIMKENVGRMG